MTLNATEQDIVSILNARLIPCGPCGNRLKFGELDTECGACGERFKIEIDGSTAGVNLYLFNDNSQKRQMYLGNLYFT